MCQIDKCSKKQNCFENVADKIKYQLISFCSIIFKDLFIDAKKSNLEDRNENKVKPTSNKFLN